MKPKLLLPISGLLAVIIAGIFACSKSNDTAVEDTTVSAKFKPNEWPTFVISKDRLAQYFVGDNSDQTITVIIRSDISNPKNSMELDVFAEGNFITVKQDEKYKTELNTKLGIGNNKITVSQISAICRTNETWINNFEYLRLTPLESTRYSGYLAFSLSACDKNGNILQLTNPSGRILSDESNPSPPADPPCPSGQHWHEVLHQCVPN